MTAGDGLAAANTAPFSVTDPKLKAFLASVLFALPWLTWQAWVLGSSFRQRRGKPVADTNALAEGAAALQAAAAAAKRRAAGQATDAEAEPTKTTRDADAEADTAAAAPISLRGRPLLFVAGVTLLFLFAKAWLARVLVLVPEPYLDEVFHIPQAQTYCAGKWLEWDDKITTPPGLYLVSVAIQALWSGVDSVAGQGCSVWALRGANSVAIMLIAVVASSCRSAIEGRQGARRAPSAQRLLSLYAFHSALNVALFPVLFFFSALYYTDLYATLAVLLAYRNHLFRISASDAPPLWSDLATVALGTATLLMRQTNIFWAVVYLGGLEAVHAVKGVRQRNAQLLARDTTFSSLPGMVGLYAWKYSHGDVHDPPVGASWPDDWALSLLSIVVAAACHPLAVLRWVWPHVAVLGGFVGFVAWNGGVVLGDKANHVATLHFAQLLYLWALMAFFSAPLFAVHAISYGKRCFLYLTTKNESTDSAEEEDTAPLSPVTEVAFAEGGGSGNKLLRLLHVVFVKKAYYPVYLIVMFDSMLAIVRYNTIIHPFTLADNRHYMFYVFRYTIRRHIILRYALVPVYALCGWACWRILSPVDSEAGQAGEYSSPFVGQTTVLTPAEPPTEELKRVDNTKETMGKKAKKEKKKAAKVGDGEGITEEAAVDSPAVFLSFLDEDDDGAATAAQTATTTSTALLWLLATALSLVSAPLVEPRYFILPWVFWRLLVPAQPLSKETSSVLSKVDVRLFIESAWFFAINVATMYVFLYRPFVWQAADGSLLDGGRQQRFMW